MTKYNDIMHVDTNDGIYSSDVDARRHRVARRADRTMPGQASSPWTNRCMRRSARRCRRCSRRCISTSWQCSIRERAGQILDNLPRNETFNWVDRVSIELTTQMLATLFDFPWQDRRKLTRWSDVATALPKSMIYDSEEQRLAETRRVRRLFHAAVERARQCGAAQRPDLDDGAQRCHASHGQGHPARKPYPADRRRQRHHPQHHDAARCSRSTKTPTSMTSCAAIPALIDSFVPEVIRWQTPLAHMRRTALQDTELGGKTIRKGDRVVMWYVSGNRDGEVIENPDSFIIDRARPRQHMSFGFGIHRCVGMRLAELQLKIVWEEILKRFETIEVVGEPKRVYSSFVKGTKSSRSVFRPERLSAGLPAAIPRLYRLTQPGRVSLVPSA